jgi:hypothetical protein
VEEMVWTRSKLLLFVYFDPWTADPANALSVMVGQDWVDFQGLFKNLEIRGGERLASVDACDVRGLLAGS